MPLCKKGKVAFRTKSDTRFYFTSFHLFSQNQQPVAERSLRVGILNRGS